MCDEQMQLYGHYNEIIYFHIKHLKGHLLSKPRKFYILQILNFTIYIKLNVFLY